eukprot:NODE_6008_length_537_cov_57.356557_g5258_i0.p3 GENE.NODE_6008_length_537_cov_57.356557_g5258_i0~~NODE_6008_length_537_cov_57.356557_g5258_i0.p3  ORF type:complete len:80 (-),score=25.21 NODE_6008_length_537_cov_57.356557_g5258_i0:24-263(-)
MALGDHARALSDANQVQNLQPKWVKGFYRKATALMALKQYEEAASVAWEGVLLDESNEELKTMLRDAVNAGREEHRQGT